VRAAVSDHGTARVAVGVMLDDVAVSGAVRVTGPGALRYEAEDAGLVCPGTRGTAPTSGTASRPPGPCSRRPWRLGGGRAKRLAAARLDEAVPRSIPTRREHRVGDWLLSTNTSTLHGLLG
jgi:hypothetical protein